MQPGRKPIKSAAEILAEINPTPPGAYRPRSPRQPTPPEHADRAQREAAGILRLAMIKQDTTVTGVAQRMGLSRAYVSGMLIGTKRLTRGLAEKMATILDADIPPATLANLPEGAGKFGSPENKYSALARIRSLVPATGVGPAWLIRKTLDDERVSRRWSTKKLGSLSGYAPGRIGSILNGNARITMIEAEDLARALGLSIQVTITRIDDK